MSEQQERLALMREVAQRVGQHLRERGLVESEGRKLRLQWERTTDVAAKNDLLARMTELSCKHDLLTATIDAERYEFEVAKSATLTDVIDYAVSVLHSMAKLEVARQSEVASDAADR